MVLSTEDMRKHSVPRILVVTACGRKKHDAPMPASELYESPRIKAVRNRAVGCDFAILSSKYGLVMGNEIIAPYEQLMTKQRSTELVSQVATRVKNYDCIVYFRGGARKEYIECLKEACKNVQRMLLIMGYAIMGGIGDLPRLVKLITTNEFDFKTPSADHIQVFGRLLCCRALSARSRRNTQ